MLFNCEWYLIAPSILITTLTDPKSREGSIAFIAFKEPASRYNIKELPILDKYLRSDLELGK